VIFKLHLEFTRNSFGVWPEGDFLDTPQIFESILGDKQCLNDCCDDIDHEFLPLSVYESLRTIDMNVLLLRWKVCIAYREDLFRFDILKENLAQLKYLESTN
jgi:hypothetical protein